MHTNCVVIDMDLIIESACMTRSHIVCFKIMHLPAACMFAYIIKNFFIIEVIHLFSTVLLPTTSLGIQPPPPLLLHPISHTYSLQTDQRATVIGCDITIIDLIMSNVDLFVSSLSEYNCTVVLFYCYILNTILET